MGGKGVVARLQDDVFQLTFPIIHVKILLRQATFSLEVYAML